MKRILAFLLATSLLLPNSVWERAAYSAPPAPFMIGTDQDEATLPGKWMRRVYAEAFKRLGIPLEVGVYPTKRLSVLADEGAVDGEMLRVHGYAAAHPNLVRVEEPVFEAGLALYAADPALRLDSLDELPATGLIAEYRRGVAVCETALKRVLPAGRLSDVTTTEQGLKKLLARRTDLYCDFDLAVLAELHSSEFRGRGPLGKVLGLGASIALHPYLHKKHGALAPRLGATLKQMKAEGLIERYRLETERELGWSR